ncbi:MAG TPA: tetratricopeptide repeat protein [Thermoanaerobaculia bacterium]|nr:tetratricopeptide repeat protein [Thermoanaerobaculia bacterium]
MTAAARTAALEIVERFRRFAEERDPDLFEGALLIARIADPGKDAGPARERVEALASRVRRLREREGTGYEALLRVLFEEEDLRGDTDSYDDPRNSSVAHVLDTGRGMPITLSIVVIEVARRASLALCGVGLPGHFIVGGADLPDGQYLDPFDGGKLRDAQAVADRVGEIFGTPVELPPEAFLPDSARAILARVLFNLRRSFEKRGRLEESLAALECAEALVPRDPSLQRERGLLLLRLGRTDEAVAVLESYVAAARGEDLEAVAKLIAVVRGRADSSQETDRTSSPLQEKKIFTLAQAREALPRVREITSDAVTRYDALGEDPEKEEERQELVREWIRQLSTLGVEVKGLWLVDFDSGAGYYCWKYPELSLEFFHGYEEGFAGRLPLQ